MKMRPMNGPFLPSSFHAPALYAKISAMQNVLLHQTDLFHPHGDPDDHWDLACVFSLARAGRFGLAGILIDYPPDFIDGDPAVQAVAQLAHCHGMQGIPVATGSRVSMTHRCDELPSREQAAGDWLLRVLRDAPAPVAVMVVGSCVDVAAAAVRAPEVFRAKCRGIYLNAGSAFAGGTPEELEWNVALNPAAYSAMFDVPCPLYWCPCWHRARDPRVGRNGTWYAFQQGDILQALEPRLQNYFLYMLSRSNDPQYLRYLDRPVETARLATFSAETRNMWCTGPILHAAGLAVSPAGVVADAGEMRERLFTFEPIRAECDDRGVVSWQPASASDRFIFTVHDVARYTPAMTTALWRLLSAPPQV